MDCVTVPGMVARIRKHAKGHLYIDQWLEAKGLNYETVGNRLGVSRTTVWRWSTEQHRLNPAKIEALAGAMGMERPADFYRMPDTRPPRPSIDKLLENEPDDTFQAVIEIARKLAHRAP